ncbi:MAG: NUDIX domain-containing protein [Candidatus Falkowbacteria bacterium]|nr:NUDIX domain-containing protein [Candidatus Falkowbacteria bacterium]
MKLLKIIQFNSLSEEKISTFETRRAARAVVFDSDDQIALLYVSKHSYYKLPGGGLESGEDINEALARECLEEIGCRVDVFAELGEIIEYRDLWSLKQHSYCYLAKVLGEKGLPDFTQEEVNDGFEIKWLPLEEAIKVLEAEASADYQGKFIQARDSRFLAEAFSVIK